MIKRHSDHPATHCRHRLAAAITAAAAAAALTLSLPAGPLSCLPVHAEARYSPVRGEQATFKKYLIIRAGTHVPHASFSFRVRPGAGRPSASGAMQVLPGTGTPSVTSVTFAPANPVNAQAQSGDIDVARSASSRASGRTADTGVELEPSKGEQYAVQKMTVDFTGSTYDEPGIYRYVLSEDPSSEHAAAGILHDDDTDRTLDVYVTDSGSGVLAVSSYVLHTEEGDVRAGSSMGSSDASSQGAALNDKTDGFTNEYKSGDLIFKHEVTGNQASRDKYFDFTLQLRDLTPGDVYTVSIADDGNPNTADGSADLRRAAEHRARQGTRRRGAWFPAHTW